MLVERQVRTLDSAEVRQGMSETNTQMRELVQESQRARQQAEENTRRLNADEAVRFRMHVANWLSAPDAISDQDHGRAVCKDHPESGHWLLQNARYRTWADPRTDTTPLLWVNGIPGSG